MTEDKKFYWSMITLLVGALLYAVYSIIVLIDLYLK